jgi:glycosyltransferase involved in cell wall biosynthesis
MPKPTKIEIVEIVIPVYNEEAGITGFHQQLRAVIDSLPHNFRLTYINDGSSDSTSAKLEELVNSDSRVHVIELSRNFGHQAAITAGLDQADADAVISMDGDGEHPAAMIPEMLALAENGFEVVVTQRLEDQQAGWGKRWTSTAFYAFINRVGNTKIQPGVGDFRLLQRNALSALKSMPEYHRFLRGMVSWIGFRLAVLPYTPARRIAGNTKFSFRKMVSLALNAIFSFSLVPLYIAITLGGVFLLLALAEAIYVLRFWLLGLNSGLAPGWSSLMFVLLIVGGMVMITLGVIGIYLGYIFQEVKGRPVYLIRRVLGK